jgi:hypothetical protein
MSISEGFSGRFIKGGDLVKPKLVTVRHAYLEDLPAFGRPGKLNRRLILTLDETDKEVACNGTSARFLAETFGDDEAALIGRQLVLYSTLMTIQGRQQPVVMIRLPRPATAAVAPAPAPTPAPGSQVYGPDPIEPQDFNDDIPF